MQMSTGARTSIATRIPLSPAEQDLLARIEAEDFSFVFERLVHAGEVAPDEISMLDVEFRKFMFLVGVGKSPMAIVGPLPDEVWHQFILFTRQYEAFCHRTLGFFVDHLPDTPMTPVPSTAGENFLVAYEQYFGRLPAIWMQGLPPEAAAFYAARPLSGPPPVTWSGWAGKRTV